MGHDEMHHEQQNETPRMVRPRLVDSARRGDRAGGLDMGTMEGDGMSERECPLGEDCDLTVAWMAGRAGAMKRIEALTAERDAALARAERAEAERDKLIAAARGVLAAVDQGRMVERGAGGMTIEAQIRRSVYHGVPAWPFEELRDTLRELEGE